MTIFRDKKEQEMNTEDEEIAKMLKWPSQSYCYD